MKHAVTVGAEVAVAMAALVALSAVVRAVSRPAHAASVLAAGLGLSLEFLLAAGLLRLANRPSFTGLGIAASIIAVRRVIGLGLGFARRALDPA
jgi:uncharacterized membrane protein